MSLRGSLRTMSVEDVLDWIDRRFVCGNLTIDRGSVVRSFHFDSGYVTSDSSNDPAEHLGQVLINRGIITEGQLNEAFKVQADTGVLLGKILVMVGFVDDSQLRAVLEEKIREGIYDALSWSEGTFRFERAPEEETVSEFEISVNLRSTIEEGQVRVGEWRELRRIIPSDEAVLFVRDRERLLQPTDSEEDQRDYASVLAAVDNGASVNQIALEQTSLRFHTIRKLVLLIDRGALAVERREEARAETGSDVQAAELERSARGRAARGDRAGALEMARSALELNPESEPLQKLHRELERTLFAELSRDLLSSFSVPRLLKSDSELASLEMTDNERYLAGRIDGRWDLLSLMRVSPLRQVEVLITFKRLADRGIISL